LTLLVIGDFILVLGFHLPIWALAASFSFGYFFETVTLLFLMNKKIGGVLNIKILIRALKIFISSLSCGVIMYVLLKFFDRSVWVKRLSFLSRIDATKNLPFEKFVLDTRYTVNLIILTAMVCLVGGLVYIVVSAILKSEELSVFINLLRRTFIKKEIMPIPKKETETLAPTPTETEN
jgi:putative peptidoglycan lipid II flippase